MKHLEAARTWSCGRSTQPRQLQNAPFLFLSTTPAGASPCLNPAEVPARERRTFLILSVLVSSSVKWEQ